MINWSFRVGQQLRVDGRREHRRGRGREESENEKQDNTIKEQEKAGGDIK